MSSKVETRMWREEAQQRNCLDDVRQWMEASRIGCNKIIEPMSVLSDDAGERLGWKRLWLSA